MLNKTLIIVAILIVTVGILYTVYRKQRQLAPARQLLPEHYNFTFESIDERNYPSRQALLDKWFKASHVARWWPVPEEHEDFFNSFLKRIRSGAQPYLVLCNDRPIGYIQTYSINVSKDRWLPKLSGNIIGIDQFVGEPEYLGKGIGTLFIKAFVANLVAKDKTVTIVVDPDPTNAVAIRCYEKVGFKKIGVYQAPWGPALIMIYHKEQ